MDTDVHEVYRFFEFGRNVDKQFDDSAEAGTDAIGPLTQVLGFV